jgi:hypothetical protein
MLVRIGAVEILDTHATERLLLACPRAIRVAPTPS